MNFRSFSKIGYFILAVQLFACSGLKEAGDSEADEGLDSAESQNNDSLPVLNNEGTQLLSSDLLFNTDTSALSSRVYPTVQQIKPVTYLDVIDENLAELLIDAEAAGRLEESTPMEPELGSPKLRTSALVEAPRLSQNSSSDVTTRIEFSEDNWSMQSCSFLGYWSRFSCGRELEWQLDMFEASGDLVATVEFLDSKSGKRISKQTNQLPIRSFSIEQISDITGSEVGADSPADLHVFKNELYFSADTDPSNTSVRRLFKLSNGRLEQVSQTHPRSDSIDILASFRGKLILTTNRPVPADQPGSDNPEAAWASLFTFDGQKFEQIYNNGTPVFRVSNFIIFQNDFWFHDSSTNLYRYDGGVVKQMASDFLNRSSEFFVYKNKLYFSGGNKIWRTDGQKIEVFFDLTNIIPDEEIQGVKVMIPVTEFGGWFYFWSLDENQRRKLFLTDGESIKQISDLNPGGDDTAWSSPTVYEDRLYLAMKVTDDVTKLFSLRGEEVRQVFSRNANETDNPDNFIEYKGVLFLTLADEDGQQELYTFDGKALRKYVNIYPGGNDGVHNLVVIDEILYFSAFKGPNQKKLFATDGLNVSIVTDTNPAGADTPTFLTPLDGDIYLRLRNERAQYKLYRLRSKVGSQ